MTNSKLALLLLVIACVMIIAWARPRSRSSIFNEVTSLPAERRMSNDILDQISPMRRPSKRSFVIKHPAFPRLKMPRSYIREGLYNELQPEIAPGGMNFYGNDVLPLSTFELLEPDTLY
ncbi:uncharacterized protein [Drosophila bipectinata]|uniref:uncharacterized protein n=1 Tax=Drosophila bipectinata TaxID=42026 RepID=UPI0038B2E825